MIPTHGLTHVALAVRDVDAAARFYCELLGAVVVYRQPTFVQIQTPGSRDVIVFEQDEARAAVRGGVMHFGFRLTDPAHLEDAAREVERAGGRILSTGEFCPGEPYLFAEDPEGYEFELWYELPTPVDPPPAT
jgi:catechol 2,3-dioxygenase-like lactoylglutathione lyase family enzyme